MYEPSGRSAARAAIRSLEAGERLVRRRRSSSPLWKQVRAPVWQAGPAGSTIASTASRSQSKRSALTACVLPWTSRPCATARQARAAVEVQLAGLARECERLGVDVRERQDLARGPVLDDAGSEPALVEGDLHRTRQSRRRAGSAYVNCGIRRERDRPPPYRQPRSSPGPGKPRMSLLQVPVERPPATAARPITASSAVSARGGSAGISRCSRRARRNAGAWAAEKSPYAASACSRRSAPASTARSSRRARDPEVEGGSNPLARQRDAVPGRVADEEHAVLRGRAQLVREPVALVADGVGAEPGGRPPASAP